MLTAYIAAALRRARYELVDDNEFCATVSGLRGVMATAKTVEQCRTQLAEVIEAWVRVRISRGLRVPALGGVTVHVSAYSRDLRAFTAALPRVDHRLVSRFKGRGRA